MTNFPTFAPIKTRLIMENEIQNIQETLSETQTTQSEATNVVKCLNCDTEFEGNFCPECGQTADTGRFTMKFIWENLLAAFTSKDGGIWFTLKSLFTRAGAMIVEILNGKRRRYFSPFPMLFFMLTVYILLYSITGSRGNLKSMEIEYLETKETVSTEMDMKTQVAISSTNELRRIFGEGMKLYNSHYTIVTMLTIPLFLFVTRLCYGRANRKRYYRAEYLIAIAYSMVMVVLYRCLASLVFLFSENASDTMGNFLPFVIIAAFTACFRKMLGFGTFKTAWRSLLAVVLYYIILMTLLLAVSALIIIIVYNRYRQA